jgi:hypothetical protein
VTVLDGLEAATDVVSLDSGSARDLLWSTDLGAAMPRLRARSIGPIQLARLGELLGLGDFDTLIRGFSLLAGESQESPWVISIPEALIEAVASLGETERGEVAWRWVRADDMPDVLTPERLQTYLAGLPGLLDSAAGPFVLFVHTR